MPTSIPTRGLSSSARSSQQTGFESSDAPEHKERSEDVAEGNAVSFV
jgi:hypothetical protein